MGFFARRSLEGLALGDPAVGVRCGDEERGTGCIVGIITASSEGMITGSVASLWRRLPVSGEF